MTRAEAEKMEGICLRCGEWTTLADSCCGAPVVCEGASYSPDEVEEDNE